MKKLKLEIPLILPGVPDEKDQCVQKLISLLQEQEGLEKVHEMCIRDRREKGVHNFNTTITIAAVSNSYIVPCKLDSCENSGYVLRGKLNVKLTDFGIDPPHKFFGIVKVNDDILIDYVFRFQSRCV